MRGSLIAARMSHMADTVSQTVNAEAEWLMRCVNYDGAITQLPGDSHVRPYLSHYAAIGLARAYEVTGKHAYIDAAWNWLRWYSTRMNATTGYVNDYTTSDGGVTWTDTGAADSTDAYAGMFLVAFWLTYKASNDNSQLTSLAASIALGVTGVTSTQQPDGLTWALPTFHARYLEDNIEALVGLRAGALLATAAGNATLSTTATNAATAMARGVGYLWHPSTTTWDWALDDSYVHTVNDWSNANSQRQQIWATAWGAYPDASTGTSVLNAYKTALPGWSTQRTSYEVLPAWAQRLLGDTTGAASAVVNIKSSITATGHAYPWTAANSGQLIVADLGMSASHTALLPSVTFPTGTNLITNPTFALDTNSDGVADGISNYGSPTMLLQQLNTGTGNAQRMIVPAGQSLDMRWAPIAVTPRHTYTFSTYRRINDLHTGDGTAILKYELLDSGGNLYNNLYGYLPVTATDASSSATRWSITMFVPDGVASVRCIVGINNGGTIDVAYPKLEDAGNPTAMASGVPAFGNVVAGIPGTPTAVFASYGNATATVNWTAPASNGGSPITGYVITTSPGGATTQAAATATSVAITGLTNGTAYTFTVAAKNAVGTGTASTPTQAVTPITTATISAITAVAQAASATLTWTVLNNGGSPPTQYSVTNAAGPTFFTTTTTEFRATGLTPGVSYTFLVAASNSAGTGPSKSVQVTPLAAHTAATLPFTENFDALTVGAKPASPWYSSGLTYGGSAPESTAVASTGTLSAPQYTIRSGYPLNGFYPGFSVGTGGTGEVATAMTGLDKNFATFGSYVECISNGFPNQIGDISSWILHMQGVKQHVVASAPIVPMTGGSLTSGVAGLYDSLIDDTYTKLVNAGWNGDKITIRLGWEWDGNNFAWGLGHSDPNGGGTGVAAQNTAANYKAMFRRYVGRARKAGFTGRFDFNGAVPRSGSSHYNDFLAAYPGNDVGDQNGGGCQIIGTDPYNSINNAAFYSLDNTTTAPNQANTFSSDPAAKYRYGIKKSDFATLWTNELKPNLDSMITFAAANNVMVGFGELGVLISHANRYCTNDTSLYYTRMKGWITDPANQKYIAYMCIFNQNQPGSGNITVTEDDQLFYCNDIGGTVPTQTWTGDTIPPPGTTISMGTMTNNATNGTTWVDTRSPNHVLSLTDYKTNFKAGSFAAAGSGRGAGGGAAGGSNWTELLLDLPQNTWTLEWDWTFTSTPSTFNRSQLQFSCPTEGPSASVNYCELSVLAAAAAASSTVNMTFYAASAPILNVVKSGAGGTQGSTTHYKLQQTSTNAVLTLPGGVTVTLGQGPLGSQRTLRWRNDSSTYIDNVSVIAS